MKLGLLSFIVALVTAPLAAQVADSSAWFAVTLRVDVVDRFNYEFSKSDEDCRTTRSGSGGGELTVRSIRRGRVQVSEGSTGLAYRPSRLTVRLTGSAGAGSFSEVRICRGAPIERRLGDCVGKQVPARVVRARVYRPYRDRIAFRRTPRPNDPVVLCGLGPRDVRRAWVDLAQGNVDEDALLNGRSRRVIVRGSALREGRVFEQGGLTVKQRATVRWTLTFRRLR